MSSGISTRTLQAPVTVAFDYTRSVGPVARPLPDRPARRTSWCGPHLGRPCRGPAAGVRPVTHAATDDFVEVGRHRHRQSWTWVPEPVAGQPLDRPFAFALVTLDGADVADAARARRRLTRRRDRPGCGSRSAGPPERAGLITDIACFEPLDETVDRPESSRRRPTRSRSPASSRRSTSTTSTPPRRRSRRSTAAWPRAGSSASAARSATRSTCRRAAPARSTASPPPTRSSCRTAAP